jgi:hypothetical protein
MLETIIGLGIIALTYAYIYSKMPEENTSFRMLFLGLSLASIMTIAWTVYSSPNQASSFTMITIGNTTTITPIENTGTNTLYLSFFYIQIVVFFFVLFMLLIGIFKSNIPTEEQKTNKEIGAV